MNEPTVFPELNAVLRELVASQRASLGENFCGAYLQGSFAVGDADEHSDVDFLVVTHAGVTAPQTAALQDLHKRLFALDVPWAQHLEGSYAPRAGFRRVDPSRAPYLYLDNGATELIWDNHCNTAVVRWSVRERGVVLAGPDPKTVVEPVSAAELRHEVRIALREWADWASGIAMSRRAQALLVLSYCRMLHTLETGRVTSKREAGEWALGALGGEWAGLIRSALDDRPDPWTKVHQRADARAAERTLALMRHAVDQATTRCADGAVPYP